MLILRCSATSMARPWWRQGLASEGARELLRYGFLDVGLRRIFAQTLTVNEPSRAVMASIRMTYVRAFPSDPPEPLVAGSDRGEVEYEITRDQWPGVWHTPCSDDSQA
jgi:RimJ/RimL family protein N-acetyltransferase